MSKNFPGVFDTMTVTVRDRPAEGEWGHNYRGPVVRTVTISAYCPTCGEKRGEPRGLNQYDDGDHYWVQTWANPCGHLDRYADVIQESRDFCSRCQMRVPFDGCNCQYLDMPHPELAGWTYAEQSL